MDMQAITIISNARDCFIELTHRNSDPYEWSVKRWKKFLWFKKRISSNWFSDKHQAIAFACDLRLRHAGEPVRYLYKRKDITRHETD
jgi:hypothetical protein